MVMVVGAAPSAAARECGAVERRSSQFFAAALVSGVALRVCCFWVGSGVNRFRLLLGSWTFVLVIARVFIYFCIYFCIYFFALFCLFDCLFLV